MPPVKGRSKSAQVTSCVWVCCATQPSSVVTPQLEVQENWPLWSTAALSVASAVKIS